MILQNIGIPATAPSYSVKVKGTPTAYGIDNLSQKLSSNIALGSSLHTWFSNAKKWIKHAMHLDIVRNRKTGLTKNLEAAAFAEQINARELEYSPFDASPGEKQDKYGLLNDFNRGKLKTLVCNQYVVLAYMKAGEEGIPFAPGDEGITGYYTNDAVGPIKKWFDGEGEGSPRELLTGAQAENMQNLRKGDVIFVSHGGKLDHVEMIHEVVKDASGKVISFSVEGALNSRTKVGTIKLGGTAPAVFTSIENYNVLMNATIEGVGQMKG